MVRMTLLAALALVVLVRPSAAEGPTVPFLIKVADRPVLDEPVYRSRRVYHARHGHARYFRPPYDSDYTWNVYPGACSAVVFPRDPLCGGPAYPYYLGPFWVW
jgi:hypothetical protein